ncbi:replication protein RepA [Vibrio parahaemolyticus]|nr:replication protein RepA [Vibrio parahaemolyticus]
MSQDLSEELRMLEICQQEGYDRVVISGRKLNVETDFRVWCGIIKAFSKYGLSSETIRLPFTEFVRLCNYPAKRVDRTLRRTIDQSLDRIQSKQITLSRTLRDDDSKLHTVKTSLIKEATLHEEDGFVELQASAKLWELYAIDHQILISRHVLSRLPRDETAQALYLFLASLPNNPHPVSIERMRQRCQLMNTKSQQNFKIRKAIAKLIDIGYLSGTWGEGKKKDYFFINHRDQKLTALEAKAEVALSGVILEGELAETD